LELTWVYLLGKKCTGGDLRCIPIRPEQGEEVAFGRSGAGRGRVRIKGMVEGRRLSQTSCPRIRWRRALTAARRTIGRCITACFS